MNNGHPGEIDIQQYALDKTACSAAVINHVASCTRCREDASSYLLLFSAINEQQRPAFETDLSSLVMKQLPLANPPVTADRFVSGFLILFVFSCVGLPLYLFRIYLLNMFSGISPFFIYTIIVCVAIVMAFKIYELYHKYQKQIRLLNFN